MPIVHFVLLALLAAGPQGQPAIIHITTSDAVDLAIARNEGYEVTKTSIYAFDLLTSAEGKPFHQGYTTIGFTINGITVGFFRIFVLVVCNPEKRVALLVSTRQEPYG